MTDTSNCLLSARLHLLFLKYLPLWRATVSSFHKTWNLLPMLCPNLVDIGPMVLEKIIRSINPISTLSWLFPLWRGTGPSIEKKQLKSLSLKDILHQVWLKLVYSDSGEEDKNYKMFTKTTKDSEQVPTWALG